MSEWLTVMLEEIARKQADAEQARTEELRRREQADARPAPRADADSAAHPAAKSNPG